MNWKQLKEFANTLDEKQLEQQCSVIIEDATYGTVISSAGLLEYDVWVNVDDSDDAGSLEDLKDYHGEDFDPNKYVLSTKKGHPFLYSFDEELEQHV